MSHSTAGGSASGVLRQAKRQSRAHWAIYSRTRNWVRSPNRNPLFSQSPDCLFLKKSIKFLQSYEKTRAEQNKYIYFLCRVSVTSLIHQQSYEKKAKSKRMNDWIAPFIPLFIYRQVIAYLICKTRKRIPVEFGSATQKLTFFIVSFSKKYAKWAIKYCAI